MRAFDEDELAVWHYEQALRERVEAYQEILDEIEPEEL